MNPDGGLWERTNTDSDVHSTKERGTREFVGEERVRDGKMGNFLFLGSFNQALNDVV